jgi:alkaline phosphatase
MLKRLSLVGCLVLFTVALLLWQGLLSQTLAAADEMYPGSSAKYVFFFIGDGMGIPQRTAAEKFRNARLMVDTFPAQGITTTYAADRFITGSAASATALAAGQKTNIGMIGMSPDQRHVKSVAEIAKEKGMKVGIVSSVSIDHATPAAFYAHVKSRSMYYDIDLALADSGFDFFGGGGIKDPNNKKKNATTFKGNALEYIKNKGYKVVNSKSELMSLNDKDAKVFAWNAWLQDSDALPYAMDSRQQDISLSEFTTKAIEMLDNSKGFFLMVEGGKIDWACHANDATASILDTLEFDAAVGKAVAFAKRHPKETLIVVTGDHECGGLTLGFAGTSYDSYFDVLKAQNVSFQKFSDEVIKPYKEGCTGTCKFDDVKPMITQHFGLKFEGNLKADQLVLEDYQIDMLEDAYLRSLVGDKVNSKDPATSLLYGGYEPLTIAITHVLNNKAGLAWTSYKHTGVPVSTSAMGVGAEIFNGYYDNTDVGKKIMAIMGVSPRIHYASHQEIIKLAANE